MSEFKNVQELILKAAMLDGVTTTIRPVELFGGYDAIEIIFSKGDRHSCTHISQLNISDAQKDAVLYACKHALYDLFKIPYEEIVCEGEVK